MLFRSFKYSGEEDRFVSDYVEKLERENISVGILTNHNKFDCDQYKAIKKVPHGRGRLGQIHAINGALGIQLHSGPG